MNLQARSVSDKRTSRKRKKTAITWSAKIAVVFYLLMMSTIISGIAIYRVSLNCKINELQKQSFRLQAESKELDQDIHSLKLERERYASLAHVQRKIAEHRMPFRSAEPQQVRYLTVRHRSGSGPATKLTTNLASAEPLSNHTMNRSQVRQ